MKGKIYAVSGFARVFMVHSCVAACKNKVSGIAIFFFFILSCVSGRDVFEETLVVALVKQLTRDANLQFTVLKL